MAYTWTTGETITAEKLNATGGLPYVTSSDNGKVLSVVNGAWAVDSTVLSVNVDWNYDPPRLDTPWNVIDTALKANRIVTIHDDESPNTNMSFIVVSSVDEDGYWLGVMNWEAQWFSETVDGYPVETY